MDFAQRLFLESPVWLGAFSFVIFAVVLLVRPRLEGAARRWALPGVLALIALLLVLQVAVTTQREEIHEALDRFVRAVEQRDTAGLGRAIGETYESEDMDRAEFLAYLKGALERFRIYDTSLPQRDVRIEGDSAEMILGARATVSIDGGVGEFHFGTWRIDWRREGGDWKIVGIRPVRIDTVEIGTLRDLRGMGP